MFLGGVGGGVVLGGVAGGGLGETCVNRELCQLGPSWSHIPINF